MTLKKLTLFYLTGYLAIGGLGFAIAPEIALKLFYSSQAYANEMVRMAGMFMLVRSALIGSITYYDDYKYYRITIIARTGIVAFLVYLFVATQNPLFLIINGIVLVGLLPSIAVLLMSK